MASLAHCIELADLHPIEVKKLTAAAAAYRKEGFKAKEANTGAVKDFIKDLESERSDVVRQIKKLKPELFKPVAKGKAVEEKPAKGRGQRSNKEGVEFYNPFRPKTRNKMVEGTRGVGSFGGRTQAYADGFFTQGHYAVKLPEAPDVKGDMATGKDAPDIKATFPDEKDLTPAYILGEYKPSRAGCTFVHAMTAGQQDTFFNADYVDVILTKYPDAKLRTTPFEHGGAYGVFDVNGEVVGLVMSTQLDVSGALKEINRIKEIGKEDAWDITKKERRWIVDSKTKKVLKEATGTIDKVDLPVPSDREIIDIHTHPDEAMPSNYDWGRLGWSNVKEMRVVTPSGTVYELSKPAKFKKTPRELRERHNAIENELFDSGRSKDMSVDEILEAINEQLAEETGIIIKKKTLEDYRGESWLPEIKPAKEPARGDILFAEKGGLADARHTVESLKAELSERIGKDALDALDRGKKVRLITLDEAVELTGRPDLRESGVQGFYSNGIVYLLPENIDRGHGFNVLMHELGVHHGYQKIFGEKLAKGVFASFVANKGKDTKLGRAVDKAMKRVERKTHPDHVNEEAVAYFTEENANIDLALHRKIIARMRLWAVKYFGVKPDIFTHDDYVALAASAVRGEAKKAAREPAREGVSREVFYSEKEKKGFFREFGAKIKGNKVILYRGGNISKDQLRNLRYGDYLSSSGKGPDVTGNLGADAYGKNIVRFELPVSDIEVTGGGEFQYKGKAESLEGGKKYPPEIYIAYNDALGSNFTAKEIDMEVDVKTVASPALSGGREEFDSLVAEWDKEDIRYSVKEQKEISKFSVPEMPIEGAAKKVIDNPNFVEWFGDSKIVNEKGEPLVVYHGTSVAELFTSFDTTMGESGQHFGTKEQAGDVLLGGLTYNRIIPAYLSIKNPLRLRDTGKFGVHDTISEIFRKEIINQEEYDSFVSMLQDKKISLKMANENLHSLLESKGYDGIVYLNRREGIDFEKTGREDPRTISARDMDDKSFLEIYPEAEDSYIAFKPTQIKSIFNVGTFDPTKADIRYSAKEKKDLHTWADNLIKSAKEDGKILVGIEAAKGPVTADDYTSNRETNKKVKLAAASNIKKVATEIVEGVDKYLGSISTRLGQISPKLKDKLRRLDFDINTKYAKDVKLVEPLLIKAKKMSKEDFADWDYARKNSDVAKINELASKYGMQKEYKVYREALARLRMEGIDVGMDIGEIEEYAPRILKDTSGFLTAIGKDPEWPLYSRLLQERANELGVSVAEMPADIKADIISNTILGGWSGLSGVPATKQRKLEKIPPELNPFYLDSDAALMQHLHSMRNGIEARKFFGKIPKKVAKMRTRLLAAQSKVREMNEQLKAELTKEETAKLERRRNRYIGLEKAYTAYIAKYATQRDYTQNIGSYVMGLIENKEISPHQEQTVNEILMARFHEAGTRGLVQDYKNLSYIDTMGSPISALTQIGDLAWAAYEAGITRFARFPGYVIRSAIGKAKITREDAGVTRIAQEFADSGMLGNAVTKVFKVVGLEKIDAIGKESLMAAALDKYQKQARVKTEELKKKIRSMFEGETDSVIEDLLSDEISENVKLLVYSRLLDFQPVGLSEMPQKYLDAGNGRLFYMLKTFTLKVFDVFRNESYYKIKNGDRGEKIQGIKNLAMLSFLFVLCNAGADELKDWVLGRKTEFSDRMVDNLLRLVGVSKFVTWKARTEGVGSALARQVLPPFKFIDSVGKDIITAGDEKGLEMLGSVPVVGKLAYWHVGRGASKREDLWEGRLRKRKARLTKIGEDFGKAKDRGAYRKKHWEELKELQAIKSLQSSLNKGRIKVNKLKSKEETPERKRAIQRLEKERTEQIRSFLKSTDRAEGVADSIWSGVLGTTAEMDATQTEINRLVESGALVQSGKPSRNINAGYGIEVKLKDDQYSRYVADTSAIIKLATDRLVARSTWQKWSDKKRAFAVKRVINKGRKIVRDRLKKTILKARLKRR